MADKTNGFSLFSKWKIALGRLLIGASITTISSCKPMCYDPAAPDPNETSKISIDYDKTTRSNHAGDLTQQANDAAGDVVSKRE